MPLIFSKNKESHNSPKVGKGSGAEILIDHCDPLSKNEPTTNLTPCNPTKTQNEPQTPDDLEEDAIIETTALKETKLPPDNTTTNDNYLTVSGTIKRGKKKGQSVEVVLNISREELEVLEIDRNFKCFHCSLKNGVGFHILLWTVFCLPISIIISGVYSFCMGTITWYNVFKLFSEKQTLCYRICIPPLLMILYPFLIISVSLGLGVYSGMKQLSCCWDSWKKEFRDYEKGFFGWLCNSLDVPECSPYEVVILSSIQKP